MASFKVPCPSCEAAVLIKNPDLVGKKVECPKCKYRFKVEQPAAAAAGEGADAKKPEGDKKKKGKEKEKAAKTPGKNKKLLKIGAGVAAVVLVIIVGLQFVGNDTKRPSGPFPKTNGPTGTTEPGKEKAQEAPKVDPGPPPTAISGRNMTNLLPGQSVAVYRLNFDRLRESSLFEALTGQQIEAAFRDSMGFELADVEAYIHCFAGPTRDPFGVLKLRTPAPPAETAARMLETRTLQPKPKAVKSRALYAIRSNPFVNAVSNALAMRSVFGEFYDSLPGAPPPPGAATRPMGVCFYDNQHVLVADYALLEKYLGDLGADGYPAFQTLMANATAPKGAGDKPTTSTDTYRTIEYPLKRALDDMESARGAAPMLVYAEKFEARQYDPKLLKKDLPDLASVLDPLAERTRYVAANLISFTPKQMAANVRLTLGSVDDSRTIAKEYLSPAMQTAADLLKLYLAAPVEFRDYTQGGNTANPGGGIPTYPMGEMGGPGGPGAMGSPAYPPGMPPGIPPGAPPGSPPGIPPGVPPGSPYGPPGMSGTDMTGVGGMPIMPPQPVSHLDLGMVDNQLLVGVDLNWGDSTYRTTVAPRMVSIASQVKGKMAIFSSDFSWHALAAVGPKYAAEHKAFPRGTMERGSNVNRFGLPYPPHQRVSFFYELLPYMGRGALKDSINPRLAWYDEKNLPTPGQDRAAAWVPELLVPYYPQRAWRATSPLAPDHVLGATNYVAVAGVGLDIARANPNSPEFKKLVGITGYDWGSKLEEVADGPANTIYLLQTPPTLQQPWIAGGGATVRGLDPDDPLAGFKYHHPDGKGGTKEGTYALMADGAVRWIPANISPKALKAMATRAGGDNADIGDIDKVAPKVEPPAPEAKTTELKSEPKKPAEKDRPEEKKPEGKDKKPEEEKPEPKATDKKVSDKKEPAPAPKEK